MATHLEQSLQRDIERIQNKILEMSRRTERALRRCLEALESRNRQLAYSVILQDHHIDELEKEIDRLCLEFLVRQQPVAAHLRFVYAAIKINAELERIGDYAENISRQILKIGSAEIGLPLERYSEIGALAISMIGDSTRAFISQDAELSRQTMLVEERVNVLRDAINVELIKLEKENRISFDLFTPLTTIARRFERVSDQAKNICEEVLYLCTGEYAKHKGTDVFRILFLDDIDAGRSQMAAAIGNGLGQPKLVFSSAGLKPGSPDPGTIAFMTRKGADTSHFQARTLDQVPNLESYQVAVALSPEAAGALRASPSKTIILDWQVADASATAAGEERDRIYEQTYQALRRNIHDLVEAVLGENLN